MVNNPDLIVRPTFVEPKSLITMRKTKNLVALALAFVLFAASKPKPDVMDKKYIKASDVLYVDMYEVTNGEYRAFLNDLKARQRTDEYAACYPDTSQWMLKFPFSYIEPYEDTYFAHTAFRNYPVVNITQKGAEAYCQWLTDNYHQRADRRFKKVVFRLPSEKEWTAFAAALPGHNLPWYGNFAYGPDQKILANVKFKTFNGDGSFDYAADGALTTQAVGKFPANSKGLFDVVGNVAEMTQSGVVKGGSWDNIIDQCGVNQSQFYILPDPRVGFRVVMEVLER